MRKKKILKKIISCSMATVIAVTSVGLNLLTGGGSETVYAAEYSIGNSVFEYSKAINGNVTITGYRGTDTVLNIPEYIDGGKVTQIGGACFKGIDTFTKMILPKQLEKICYEAFYDCDGLTEIEFPTTLKTMQERVFGNCDGLTEIDIPDNVSGSISNWFKGCSNLEKISIGKGITTIDGGSFYGLSKLKEVTFSEGLEKICYEAFYDCDGLTEIEFPTTLKTMQERVFGNCDGLTEVDIPDNVSGSISNWFKGCSNLEKISIGKGITTIDGGSFYGLSKLKEVTFSEGLEKICYEAFYDCDGLTKIEFPKTLKTMQERVFKYCDNLQKIYFHGAPPTVGSSFIPNNENICAYYNINGGDWSDIINKYNLVNGIPFEGGTIKDLVMSSVNEVRHMETGEKAEIKVSLIENNILAEEQGTFSFVTSDTGVIDVSNIYTVADGTMFTVTAKGNGTALLTVTNNETGEVAFTTITVGDRYVNNSADYVPQYKDFNDIYNYYEAGMYVSEFKKTEYDEDSYKITMNVYNSVQVHGSLDVYNAEGQVIESVRIEKFDGGNVTSIGNTIGRTIDLVEDIFKGHLLSFKNRTYSTVTKVEVIVPKGGHIFLTNSVAKSDSCLTYNCMDILVFSITTALGLSDEEAVNEGLYKELMKAISEPEILNKFLDAMKEELAKEITLNNGVQIISDLSGNAYPIIADLGIDLEQIIADVAKDLAISLPEDFFIKVSGFAGIVLKGLFTAGEYFNFTTQVINTFRYKVANGLRIDTKTKSGELADNSIKVNTEDLEYVLRTFQVEDESTLNRTESMLGKEDFVLYDIYMLKHDEVAQPTGTVNVMIPIPKQYTPDRLKVYRIEEGNKVDMNARVEGEYLVFETNHFSLYAIVEADYMLGDVNGDEKLDTQDAVLIKKYLAGYVDLEVNVGACDINKDGYVNSADAVILLKHLAGYEVGLAITS